MDVNTNFFWSITILSCPGPRRGEKNLTRIRFNEKNSIQLIHNLCLGYVGKILRGTRVLETSEARSIAGTLRKNYIKLFSPKPGYYLYGPLSFCQIRIRNKFISSRSKLIYTCKKWKPKCLFLNFYIYLFILFFYIFAITFFK